MQRGIRGIKMHITLPDDCAKKLDEMCKAVGISRSALIAVAVSEKYRKEASSGQT